MRSITTFPRVTQALAGNGYSYLFAQSGGGHPILMVVGAATLIIIILSGTVRKLLAKPARAAL